MLGKTLGVGDGALMKTFAARRFAPAGSRPDCFEVYEVATGKSASFPGRKGETERYAKKLNDEEAGDADASSGRSKSRLTRSG